MRARQAVLAVRLDAQERARQADAGVPAARRGRGVAAQVGLARRCSPHQGQVLLGAATAWTEMPATSRALAAGAVDEWSAVLLARETACLQVMDRARVDELVCGDLTGLEGQGPRRLVAAARRHAAGIDPGALVRRARRAAGDRTVTLRPAPDTMTYLTALLPVAQGVAALAALQRHADGLRAGGDTRGRGQVMADTLVERLTGQVTAERVPVCLNVVLPATALTGGAEAGLLLEGGTVLPAPLAHDLVLTAAGSGTSTDQQAAGATAEGDPASAWVRRLYADPGGTLIASTSSSRLHPDALATLVRARDGGICRTPWCDAPVRHTDHVIPAADGGPTDLPNAQGLCVACNHAKQTPGWSQHLVPTATGHTVTTTTPWGMSATSTAPRALLPEALPAAVEQPTWGEPPIVAARPALPPSLLPEPLPPEPGPALVLPRSAPPVPLLPASVLPGAPARGRGAFEASVVRAHRRRRPTGRVRRRRGRPGPRPGMRDAAVHLSTPSAVERCLRALVGDLIGEGTGGRGSSRGAEGG
ncbi:HNH endonuclease [Cellulomonas marina]|uniref:HNH endonuclease n=1 Tax=Cellulomonas marina TaxID=988821 RepID=A0A1I0WUR2_9CELL|nr:HNH endonuclease [Cellulomonas marina]SFA91693.1 HNH endonuclease [Cellulomonas marina]